MDRIRVLLVENDTEWINLMSRFLLKEEGLEVIAAQNSQEALRAIKDIEIDVILMDINLSGSQLDGLYLSVEISKKSHAKVIMLTSLDPQEAAVNAFNSGAVAYISKGDYKRLPAIIKNICKGNAPMEILLEDYRRLKRFEVMQKLTKAEMQVLTLLEKGYSRNMIQKRLVKSESTIKNQISSILNKLEVSNTKDAVIKVNTRGLQ